jgi:hypothetical protein
MIVFASDSLRGERIAALVLCFHAVGPGQCEYLVKMQREQSSSADNK